MNDLSDGGGATEAVGGRSSRRPLSPRSARELLQPEQVPPPPVRSRAARHPLVVFFNFFITVAVVAVLIIGGIALYAKVQFDRDGPLTATRVIEVSPGDGVSDISENLQNLGIITNRWVFRAGVTLYGAEGSLQAGEYLIPAQASMREIVDILVSGQAIVYNITIPEGLTSYQIVQRLLADETLTGEIAQIPPEGSLLPDTYRFNRGESRQAIIDRMMRERDRVVADIWSRRVEGLPISTPAELVTLASIVEKETGIADERSRVAAVFINRLRLDMRLQADPTVVYGIWGGQGMPANRIGLTTAEVNRPTEYNTYTIAGLPPGPIANPGRAALEAVANPSRTNDLYFVADGTGGHAFASTLDEHNRNVARYRQIQADAAAAAAARAAEEAARSEETEAAEDDEAPAEEAAD